MEGQTRLKIENEWLDFSGIFERLRPFWPGQGSIFLNYAGPPVRKGPLALFKLNAYTP